MSIPRQGLGLALGLGALLAVGFVAVQYELSIDACM
jgi:hypothetical protein